MKSGSLTGLTYLNPSVSFSQFGIGRAVGATVSARGVGDTIGAGGDWANAVTLRPASRRNAKPTLKGKWGACVDMAGLYLNLSQDSVKFCQSL